MRPDDAVPTPRAGQASGSPPAKALRALTPGVLRTVFLDIQGRPPFAMERETWLGREFDELLDALVGSEDFWMHWLDEQLYYFLLIDNFRPASPRFTEAPANLAQGRLDVFEVLLSIGLSSSFEMRNPGADTFVTVVMEQICGIDVHKRQRELEIGKRIYDGARGSFLGEIGSSQADIVRIAVESRAAAETLMAREYERHMHVGLDPRSVRDLARRLRADPSCYSSLLREALASDAYARRLAAPIPISNRLFVRGMFVDLLDRLPDRDEAEPLREALDALGDSAPLRGVLVRLLLDSGRLGLPAIADIPDHAAFVVERFGRLLGRGPSAEELESFVTAMSDPACRTETVLYAILTHPEYHRY